MQSTTKKRAEPWWDCSPKLVARLAGGRHLSLWATISQRCSLSIVGGLGIRNFSASFASRPRYLWQQISSGPGDTWRPIVTFPITILGRGTDIGWHLGSGSGGLHFSPHSCMPQCRKIGCWMRLATSILANPSGGDLHSARRALLLQSRISQGVFAAIGSLKASMLGGAQLVLHYDLGPGQKPADICLSVRLRVRQRA